MHNRSIVSALFRGVFSVVYYFVDFLATAINEVAYGLNSLPGSLTGVLGTLSRRRREFFTQVLACGRRKQQAHNCANTNAYKKPRHSRPSTRHLTSTPLQGAFL